ncbi:MAG TPA: hypothetical protein VI977_06810 [archaeon]|nr:hypothetical protein [archaeon]
METVILKGKELAKALSKEQLKELGLNENLDFEITKIKQGILIFAEKEPAVETPKAQASDIETLEIDSKIFGFLSEKKLSERVEGKFEKFLNAKELARFKELLKEGRVFAFKLSEQYKKPVYKIAPQKTKETEKPSLEQKPMEQYCLETDGLMVCTDKAKAEKLSFELRDAIKSAQISGIKSFDGNYYIVETELLQKYKPVVSGAIKSGKKISLEEISKRLGISKILARVVCEFLKDDGEIIEKTRDLYQFVE